MPNGEFKKLREKIDRIDSQIIKLIGIRNKTVLEIKKIKDKSGQKIKDNKREKQIFKKVIASGKKINLNSSFIKKIFRLIIDESIKIQKKT